VTKLKKLLFFLVLIFFLANNIFGQVDERSSQVNLEQVAKNQEKYLQRIRKELHKFPEVRFETKRTRTIIKREINNLLELDGVNNCETSMEEEAGGILVKFTFNPSYANVALRADFDALPITENTDLEFASQNEGVMHACGHDIHTAWLLATMRAIAMGQVQPLCNIIFIFEDGEENPITDPGSKLIVDNGKLFSVSEIYGLHIWAHPNCEPGVFYTRSGALMGNSGRLGIYIHCAGGHVAEPHIGSNGLRIN